MKSLQKEFNSYSQESLEKLQVVEKMRKLVGSPTRVESQIEKEKERQKGKRMEFEESSRSHIDTESEDRSPGFRRSEFLDLNLSREASQKLDLSEILLIFVVDGKVKNEKRKELIMGRSLVDRIRVVEHLRERLRGRSQRGLEEKKSLELAVGRKSRERKRRAEEMERRRKIWVVGDGELEFALGRVGSGQYLFMESSWYSSIN